MYWILTGKGIGENANPSDADCTAGVHLLIPLVITITRHNPRKSTCTVPRDSRDRSVSYTYSISIARARERAPPARGGLPEMDESTYAQLKLGTPHEEKDPPSGA